MREDSELVSQATRGDRGAFTELMSRHQARVHRLVARLVRGEATFDIVQETFVSAWRNLHKFDQTRAFPAWLHAIALNKCRDYGRRNAVRRFITGDWDAASADTKDEAAPNPEQIVEDRQTLSALERAIGELPVNLKEALVLTALEGLSHAEAAAILGASPKGVETRIYRARQILAAKLGLS